MVLLFNHCWPMLVPIDKFHACFCGLSEVMSVIVAAHVVILLLVGGRKRASLQVLLLRLASF